MCKVLPKTQKQIRSIVDFIYAATINDGANCGFTKYPVRVRYTAGILTKRGILVNEGHSRTPNYRWVATSAPTSTLYESVAKEVVQKEREISHRYREKKKAENKSEVMISGPIKVKAPEKNLDGFSSQALWDELKRRGFVIDDGRIVLKQFLD